MWGPAGAVRPIDGDATKEDLEHVWNSLQDRRNSMEEDPVFVDTIGEDAPTFTPFNGQTLVTRLPYRIVTQTRPEPFRLHWMVDNNYIIGLPVSAMLGLSWLIFTNTRF